MAISLLEQNRDDENQNKTSNLPTLGGDRGAGFSTGMNPNPAAPKGSSGRFTNLKKYLEANTQGSQNIADRVGSSVDKSFNEYQNQFTGKVGDVNKSIGDVQSRFDTEGNQFKNAFGTINNELNTFQSMDNRGDFDKGQQSLFDFNRDYGNKFTELRTGLGLNEDQLKQSEGMIKAMNDQRLAQAQREAQGIQTEQGRYGILKQAQPKFGNYGSGQARLDQLLLQGSPGAIGQLQSTFNQNLGRIKNDNVSTLGQLGSSIQDIIGKESALMGELQGASDLARNTFVNKLNQQSNFDRVQQVRDQVYDNYLNQLKSGNISGDLANILGLSGLESSWSAAGPNRQIDPRFEGATGGLKGFPTENPNKSLIEENQFRLYDVLGQGGANAQSYLQRGRKVQGMQDIMSQNDYDAYMALRQLSGATDPLLASGKSTLDKAVSASGNLVGDINRRNQEFKNIAGQRFQGLGAAERSYQVDAGGDWGISTGITNTRGSDRDIQSSVNGSALSPTGNWDREFSSTDFMADPTQTWESMFNTINNLVSGGTGTIAATSVNNSLNDYLYSGKNRDSFMNPSTTIYGGGDYGSRTAAENRSEVLAKDALTNYLNSLVQQTGVENLGTIDNTKDTIEQNETFKRFKGLI